MRHFVQSLVRSFLMLFIATSAVAGTLRPTGESVPGEVLIKIQANASQNAVSNILAGVDSGERLADVPSGSIWKMTARGKSAEALVEALQKNPNVTYAEPNYLLQMVAAPNDTQYSQLWGLKNLGQVVGGATGSAGADIDAEAAWTVTTGSASIVIGVVDTGVAYNHPDLAANMWSNPGGKGRASCAAGTHGFNAINDTCNPMDDNNHGTHVAGTIGAVGNNGLGVTGVNWTTSIMALKFLNSGGYGTTADAIEAIDFAVQAKIDGVNVRVLSNSWGGGGFSKALLDEINKANEHDILFVASAGNNSANADSDPHYPSSYTALNVISVAATDNADRLAWFSNYGATTVHLGAPGVSVLSTVRFNGYEYFNGTSMAAPHVAGVAALLLAKTPGLSTAELKEAILDSTDPISSLAGKTITGGRLNAGKALGAPVGAEFTLSISPATRTVARDSSTSYTVTISPSNGFAGSVALSAGGLPSGVTASFSPAAATTTSTLTLTTSSSAQLGPVTFTVSGVSGALTRSAQAEVYVVGTVQPAPCPTFGATSAYAAGTPTAVTTGDFNRDGRIDVAVAEVSQNGVLVRFGNGSTLGPGAFYETGNTPISIATGDFNADGRLDLVVANAGSGNVSVLLATSSGGFAAAVHYGAGSSPFAVAVGDVNNDGKSDLAVANNASGNVSILIGAGDGTFGAAVHHNTASGPFAVAIDDLDGDGNADLAVANYNAGNVSVLLGTGNGSFAAAVHYQAAGGASSVATADFNRDGRPDLAVTNYTANKLSIFAGNGDGTFQGAVNHPTGAGPSAASVADFNRDGKIDVVIANGDSNNVSILLGDGNGAFAVPILRNVGYDPTHLSITDFNSDGRPDFAVTNSGEGTVVIVMNLSGCPVGCVAAAAPELFTVSGAPHSLTAADFNRDGRMDVAAATRGGNNVSVGLGNGDGTFTAGAVMSAGTNPDSVTSADFNRDGNADLAVANSGSNNVSVLLGNGDGTFASAVNSFAGSTPRSVVSTDVNRDGKVDLVLATAGSNSVAVMLGNGDGTFQAPLSTAAGTTPFHATPGDFNADGKVDLAAANSGSNNVSILIGNGDGTFQPATHFNVGTSPRSIAVADFNRDGKADLGVANAGSSDVSVLHGQGNGAFQAAVQYATYQTPVSIAAGDLNNDGIPDLVAASNTSLGFVSVLAGSLGGTLQSAVTSAAGSGPAGVVVADFDRDGRSDLAVASSGSSAVALLRNNCPSPDLTMTKTHTDLFTQGDKNKTYRIVVRNDGVRPTLGTITVKDTLPAGLHATAISGSGWTCAVGSLTCTSTNVIAAGDPSSPITVTVDVSPTAPASVTNTAVVAGGGERNTTNNSASDVTAITARPDLVVALSHAGSFTQGSTGKTYKVVVRNLGGAPTSGLVTIQDTLPAGLTATGIAGSGWSCSLPSLTCNRPDALAPSSSYPPVTITVNVAANAPASVYNYVNVTGGGESAGAAAANGASDLTVIWSSQNCGGFGSSASYSTGADPGGLASGKFNADAFPDLAVANYNAGTVSILLGKADGSFHAAVSYPAGGTARAVAVGDIDIDGHADLIVTNSSPGTISYLRGNGTGTFATPVAHAVGSQPSAIVITDLDHDQRPDIAVSNYNSDTVSILLNSGGGLLRSAVSYAVSDPRGLTFADFDGNGTQDMAVANFYNGVAIHRGRGDGTFEEGIDHYAEYSTTAVVAGDFDQDGKIDLATSSYYYGAVTLLRGNGDLTFDYRASYSTQYGAGSLAAEDLNGDGRTDLITGSESYSRISMLLSNGDGTFQPAVHHNATGPVTRLVILDLNGDRRPDFAVTSYSIGMVEILLGGCADLSIVKSHTGNFTSGQQSALYQVAVTNVGAGSTLGVVTVTDQLPAGLSIANMYGDGWWCDLDTATCSRSDVLAPGASYPELQIWVYVAANTAANVVNTAVVSGGGDGNAANNTDTDPTTIVQTADLTITKTTDGMFAQGQLGRTYTITATNSGGAATNGTVFVQDLLPTGLVATDISGQGWTCYVSSLFCSREDVLAAGASYPPIVLTVNVSSNAPAFVTNYAKVSGGGEATTNNNSASVSTSVLGTPGNLVATGTGSQVYLTWTPAVHAVHYELYRSNGAGPFVLLGTMGAVAFSDTTTSPNHAYLYRVRAVSATIIGAFSNADLATTVIFAEDPLHTNSSILKASHVTEVQGAINTIRTAAGLSPTPFPAIAAGTPVQATHWTQMRTSLNDARTALGLLLVTYSDATMGPGTTIRAAHLRELRTGVR